MPINYIMLALISLLVEINIIHPKRNIFI